MTLKPSGIMGVTQCHGRSRPRSHLVPDLVLHLMREVLCRSRQPLAAAPQAALYPPVKLQVVAVVEVVVEV